MNDFVFERHALNTPKEIIKLVYRILIKMYVSFGINKSNIAIFYELKAYNPKYFIHHFYFILYILCHLHIIILKYE